MWLKLSRFLPFIPLCPANSSHQHSSTLSSYPWVIHIRPCGYLQRSLLLGCEFLPLLQFPQIFTARGFEAFYPCTGTLDAWFVSLPSCSGLSAWECGTTLSSWSSSCHLAVCPLCHDCPSLPLLVVWMNVSSLTPWFSHFHVVWFSDSSGCF